MKLKTDGIFWGELQLWLVYLRRQPPWQRTANLLSAEDSHVQMQKGLWKFTKKTTEIPMITKATNPDYHFGGHRFMPKNENTCKCKVIIRIPKAREVKVNTNKEKLPEYFQGPIHQIPIILQ